MSDRAVTQFERIFAVHQRKAALRAALGWLVFILCFAAASLISHVNLPRLFGGIGKFGEFFALMLPDLDGAHLFDSRRTEGSISYWYYGFETWTLLLWESIEIAILATVLGFVGAFLLSFPAARNLGVPRVLTFLVRRGLEFCRIVPELVSGLIFAFAFGIGPLAGVLAVSIHTVGALGKLFSEVHENTDREPIEGVIAAGGSWGERVRFGVVPQVLPNLLSYTLLRFEINVAASTALGVVGAGGIGKELRAALDLNYYPDLLAMILMIVVCIFLIDLSSEFIRTRFMRGAGTP